MKLASGQYYGSIFQTANINGLILTKSDYEQQSSIPKHYHNNPYFCYVLDGCYTEHSSQKRITCSKGDIIFHPKETEHYNQFKNSAASCFNIEFSGVWIGKIADSKLEQKNILSQNHPEIQNIFRKIYREFIDADTLSDLMIEGLSLEMMVAFSRTKRKYVLSSFYVKRILRYIEEIFPSNPTLAELANLFRISPEYLSRTFKKSTGITIGEYIRHQKIQRACKQMQEKNADIHSIALECGFTDQSHFTKVFKKVMHMTPGMYLTTNSRNYTKKSRTCY